MSPEFRTLLIKDGTERRSLFGFALVFILGFLGYCIAYELEFQTRSLIAGYYHSCLIFGQLGSVLLAMHVVAGEYSQRTVKFSASLPVSMSTIGWSRLLVAWGCLIVPMLLGGIIVTLLFATGLIEQAGLRSDSVRLPDRPSLSKIEAIAFLWTTVAVAVACTLQLVSVLTWLGTRCRTEGAVGSIGVILILFSQIFTTARRSLDSLGMFLLSDWIGGLIPTSMLISWGYGELDGSSYSDLDLAPLVVGPLILNLLITIIVASRFASRYGRRTELAAISQRRRWLSTIPSLFTWLPIPRRNQVGALVWLNTRESVPISLAGLFIAASIALIGRFLDHSTQRMSLDHFRGSLPENTWFVGVLWGAVVAVSVFGSDLKKDLQHFWSSRPITPTQWFWTKFIVGLVAVLGALDGIPAIIAWNVPYAGTQGRMGFVYLSCMPLIHALAYAFAVATICQLRRPIPAAMIAILMFFIFEGVIQSIPVQARLSTIHVYNDLNAAQVRGENLDLMGHGYPIVYGIVSVAILVSITLARRSVTRSLTTNVGVLLVIAVTLHSSGTAHGDDSEVVKEVVAGFRAREALVKDIHLGFKVTHHRTDLFFQVEAAAGGRSGHRPRVTSSTTPRDEELTYELFERSSYRMWTIFGPGKTIKSRTAFDGATQCDYTAGIRRAAQGTITNATQGSRPATADPDSILMGTGEVPLIGILEQSKLQHSDRREVDGEKLIDLIVINQFSDGEPGSAITRYSKHEVTVNVTRNYWPIRVRHEHSKSFEGVPFSIIEVKADQWMDTKPIAYPRHVLRSVFVSPPDFTGKPNSTNQTLLDSAPELSETQDVEMIEVALNTDFSDKIFQPAFPPATVVYDFRNGKHFEADSTGELKPYVPKPAGIRGAVFFYHLIWIVIAVTYLFVRRTEAAGTNVPAVSAVK